MRRVLSLAGLGSILLVAACAPQPAPPVPTRTLDPLEDANDEGEGDVPPTEGPTDTLPDGVQIPWIGPVSPGVAGETNTVTVTQTVPGHDIFLLLAPTGGSFLTPDCGLELDLDDPELLGIVEADAQGVASYSFFVDVADADIPMVLQAVDLDACVVSAPSSVTFKDLSGGVDTTTTGGTTPPATTPPSTTPSPPASDQTCYPGDRSAYDVCVDLEPAGSQGSDYVYPTTTTSNYAAPTHFLRLTDIPGSIMVAPNFRRDELAQEWKGDWAVVQVHAVERLQDLRDDIGALVVNSGYRSPAYNDSVGGATLSRHMYGDAFDLDPVSVTLNELESACYAHGAGFVSVYVSHVHCDWRDDSQEPDFYGLQGPSSAGPGSLPFEPLGLPTPDATVVWQSGRLEAPVLGGFDCGEPLREWSAYDADGTLLATATGPSWVPPEGASEVVVRIGRVVERSLGL